jgi:hypothetical protein
VTPTASKRRQSREQKISPDDLRVRPEAPKSAAVKAPYLAGLILS